MARDDMNGSTSEDCIRSGLAGAFGDDFRIIACSVPGTWDPGISIAASRAAEAGLLDLTHLADPSRARWAIDRLNRLGGESRGLVVHDRLGDVELAAHASVIDPEFVLILPDRHGDLDEVVDAWSRVARQVGLVVSRPEEFALTRHPKVDFIVGKGHESGGTVAEETSFILLQRLLKIQPRKPVYVWGGIGPRTAAACRIAGAAGVVLDWQLSLTRESSLPTEMKRRLARMDGSETVIVKGPDGKQLRLYDQPGMSARERLETAADAIHSKAGDDRPASAWNETLTSLLNESEVEDRLWLTGQDACLASTFVEDSPTVGIALAKMRDRVERIVEGTFGDESFAQDSPLAKSHGTQFPITQGPMTRVSDVPEFCGAIAEGGGLPFLALSLMRGPEARDMLARTAKEMGGRPWGVGLLGFISPEHQKEQFAAIEEIRPGFAIIAGGRPDQAAKLEAKGIRTYLHVPSPLMLEIFIKEGARRFIFEGRECGGHVGPRSSFVLWETMVQVLENAQLSDEEAAKVHVLFAGGICDGLGAASISAIGRPLVDRGMKIGLLLGTAYLCTDEAVSTGAILDAYQKFAMKASRTTIIESSPGHCVRCVPNSYTEGFETLKAELKREGKSTKEIGEQLDLANIGRLRIASKGVRRATENNGSNGSALEEVPEDEQLREGMYMLGQIAPLCGGICSIRKLHERVCDGSLVHLELAGRELAGRELARETHIASIPTSPPPLDVAIVGMSCLLPGADTPQAFWQNILENRDLLQPIPPDRFDIDRWYGPRGQSADRVYATEGGFVEDIYFNPRKFGIPPHSLKNIEPIQLLALELVDRALRDVGHDWCGKEHPRKERASIIFGAGGGGSELSSKYLMRATLPQHFGQIDQSLLDELPDWTEDSFAGILMNVIAGRVANRFDLGGANFTVDAACASSLAAVYLACRELADGSSDMVIAGGCDTSQTPFGYLCFATAGALSPRGKSRTFDASADGIAISEGLAAVVLKRREDAERDGDRIYALIRAAAAGSDGRSMGMTAPSGDGQARTFRRAYRQAGFSPASVELFEAHGTGTAVGDKTECQSLARILEENDTPRQNCAIGSVKSNIGHTKATAGVAGLMKAALALHHRVLPPTNNVESLDPEGPLVGGSLYANTELRPWVRCQSPRRAGVSSFGFGGTNFHVVLEDYERDALAVRDITAHGRWPSEIFIFAAKSKSELADRVERFRGEVESARTSGARTKLADLAFTAYGRATRGGSVRAAVVASDIDDLLKRLDEVDQKLRKPDSGDLPRGSYIVERPLADEPSLALLFPGQGSQFPNMIRDLAVEFPECRDSFERADSVLRDAFDRALSRFVFPVPTFDRKEVASQIESLKATNVAQPALGTSMLAVLRLLDSLKIRGQFAAGHSYGELVALHAAGSLDERSLLRLSQARGQAMVDIAKQSGDGDLGSMMAVRGDGRQVESLLEGCPNAWIANLNSPRQTVISGTKSGLERAVEILGEAGLSSLAIPVACAFHTSIMAPARESFESALRDTDVKPPRLPIFANRSAARYPSAPDEIRQILSEQIVSPVLFTEEIENMYRAGGRVFLEVGPNGVLSKLVGDILRDRPHVAIATQPRDEHGITGLLQALGQLFVHGVEMDLERLFSPRQVGSVDFRNLAAGSEKNADPNSWLVNGSYVRPVGTPRRDQQPGFAAVKIGETMSEEATSRVEDMKETTPREDNEQPATTGKPSPPRSAPLPPVQQAPRATASPGVPAPARVEPTAADSSFQGNAASDDPYAQFQETMRQFLRTQEAVMGAYFGSEIAPVEPSPERLQHDTPAEVPPPAIVPETAEQPEIIQSPQTVPESRGVQNPISAVPTSETPIFEEDASGVALGPDPEEPTASTQAETVDLEAVLREIMSDRTGYPSDTFELDINLESELGIDSIKRVEIIAAFRRTVSQSEEDPPAEFVEAMTTAKSMRDIIDGMKYLPGMAEAAPEGTMQPAADQAAVSAEAESLDLESVLREIMSDRTGYPPDTFELDINLESELGIDSIKRVEIIAAFRRTVSQSEEDPPAEFVEAMTTAKSMRDIIDGMKFLPGMAKAAPVEKEAAVDSTVEQSDPEETPAEFVPRCIVRAVEAPLVDGCDPIQPEGVIVLTDDGQGIAKSLAEALIGSNVEILPAEVLASRESTIEAVDTIRRHHGGIAGAVHLQALAPAQPFPAADCQEWATRTESEIKSALYLMQALEPELVHGTFFACVSCGGGDFDANDTSEAAYPWRGGLTGMLKCAAKEWTASRLRTIDFAEIPPDETLLRIVMQEWTAEGPVEVGYRHGRRLALRAERVELQEEESEPSSLIDSDSVVLITGGARGITSEIAIELAQKAQPTLVLLGRSPSPTEAEAPATAGIESANELRKILLAEERKAGPDVALKDIEAKLRSLLAEREIRNTLTAIADAGGRGQYISCDVRDASALQRAVEEVRERFGEITAVVHGAGVLEDKYIVDKTSESFDRVMSTKIEPMLTLVRILDPSQLKLCMLFGSVAGFFGNAGQCDYAAANETLNRMARRLDQMWPGKVATMNWGPWTGTGMVTPEVARQFMANGIPLVSVPAGRRAAWLETLNRPTGEIRVLIGSGDWVEQAEEASPTESTVAAAEAQARESVIQRGQDDSFEMQMALDPTGHAFLYDHKIDGRPVLPFTVALAAMVEMASKIRPRWCVTKVSKVRQFSGIVVEQPRQITLRAEFVRDSQSTCECLVRVFDEGQPSRPCYEATVHFAATAGPTPKRPPLKAVDTPFPLGRDDAYGEWLFHGPAFQAIEGLGGCNEDGIDAKVRRRPLEGDNSWLVDPIVLDVAPQLAILWSRALHDTTALPNRVESYEHFGPLGEGPVDIAVRVAESADAETFKADVWFMRGDTVVGIMRGLEGASSASLNRLAEVASGSSREVAK